jgi:DNA polymerase III subunit delta
MSILTLTNKLSNKTIEPIYFIHGQENYLIQLFLQKIKELVVTGPMGDFNYIRQKINETTGPKIVAEAKSMPMMASRKLIIIDDIDKLKTSDTEALVQYLENPSPDNVLIFLSQRLDLRKGLFKKASQKKIIYAADPLREKELPSFIFSSCQKRNVKITPEAQNALIVAIGPDCSSLDDAMERLSLYCEFSTIELTHVEAVVSSVRTHSVFELVDALGNKNHKKVMQLLFELLANREEPLKLNSLITRHFRQLLKTRIYLQKKVNEKSIISMLGIPPFAFVKLKGQSKYFSGVELEKILRRLSKVDLELKSSKKPPSRTLEKALIDLCYKI